MQKFKLVSIRCKFQKRRSRKRRARKRKERRSFK